MAEAGSSHHRFVLLQDLSGLLRDVARQGTRVSNEERKRKISKEKRARRRPSYWAAWLQT
jgi:hypothetical protein